MIFLHIDLFIKVSKFLYSASQRMYEKDFTFLKEKKKI